MMHTEGESIFGGRWAVGLALAVGVFVVVVVTSVRSIREDMAATTPRNSSQEKRLAAEVDKARRAAPPAYQAQPRTSSNQDQVHGRFGNADLRENLPIAVVNQASALRDEARSSAATEKKDGKRALALSEERIDALQKSGNLIH